MQRIDQIIINGNSLRVIRFAVINCRRQLTTRGDNK